MTLAAHTAEGAHGGHISHIKLNTAGLWLFFLSETFLFGALLAGRFYLAGTEKPDHLNQHLGLAITSVLLASSFTAYSAELAISKGRRGIASLMVLATIGLGLVFFGGVVIEWSTAEFSQGEPYGTAFFAMTGLHASHVLSGVVILVLVLGLLARGRFTRADHWGVEAAVKYWHFVDLVWVFFYPALYLLK